MKRALILIAAAALLLCTACGDDGGKCEVTPVPVIIHTPEPSPTPTPEPASVPGTVRADGTRAFYKFLDRGDAITLAGSLENYYVISLEGVSMLIEKRFVRVDSESAPEVWSGFAKSGAAIFDTAYLNGTQLASLQLNDALEVLDSFDGIAFVKYGEVTGYMDAALVSATKTVVQQYGGGYDSGYSGGGGGSAPSGGGGGAPDPGPSSSDGGDIDLGYRTGTRGGIVLLGALTATEGDEGKSVKPVPAKVLTDRLPVYLDEFKRGDAVKITASEGAEWSVLINGKTGLVTAKLLRLDSDAPYAQWNGFAADGAVVFDSYTLTGSNTALQTNTVITVLDDLGDVYVVEINGVIGYMTPTHVSDTEIVHYYYGGGGDSGSGGGGGGGGGGGAPVQEFTEEIL